MLRIAALCNHHYKLNLCLTIALFISLLLTISGCGGGNGPSPVVPSLTPTPTSTPPRVSGIRGVALNTFLPGAPPNPPAPRPTPVTLPLRGAIITIHRASTGNEIGREIARQTTDFNGRFQFTLALGAYLMVPLPVTGSTGPTFGNNQVVVVRPNTITNLTVRYITPLP